MLETLETPALPADRDRKGRLSYLAVALPLAALLLYFSLRHIAWVQVGHTLGSAKWRYVALALCSSMLALSLRALRWRVLLLGGCRVTPWTTFLAASAGYLGNNVLPARAGELIRTLLITRRSGASTSFVITTVACERVSDAVALVAIAATTLLLLPVRPAWLSHATVPFAVLGCVGVAGICVSPQLQGPFRALIGVLPVPAALRNTASAVMDGVVAAVRQFHEPARLWTFVGLTGAIWIVDAATAFLTGASLGLAFTLPMVLLLNSALGLSSAVPSTPGYVGVYQFVAISVLTPFGFSSNAALAYIVMAQACSYLIVMVWGTVGLVSLRRTSEGEHESRGSDTRRSQTTPLLRATER